MATAAPVYNTTTVQERKRRTCFIVPTESLGKIRCAIKVAEVLLSCVAFVVEEVVPSCLSCRPLYFFEFVSCTAFLFTLLLLILLATNLHHRVAIKCWPTVDFGYTISIAILFLLASVVFAADNSGTSLEQTAVAFGFLATVAFFLDVGVFVRVQGNPCRNRSSQPTDNGNAGTPENQKLNTNGTD